MNFHVHFQIEGFDPPNPANLHPSRGRLVIPAAIPKCIRVDGFFLVGAERVLFGHFWPCSGRQKLNAQLTRTKSILIAREGWEPRCCYSGTSEARTRPPGRLGALLTIHRGMHAVSHHLGHGALGVASCGLSVRSRSWSCSCASSSWQSSSSGRCWKSRSWTLCSGNRLVAVPLPTVGWVFWLDVRCVSPTRLSLAQGTATAAPK